MLDWKLVDDIQTLLCLYLCFKSLLQEYTFYGIKIMTEHEYIGWRSPQNLPTNNVWPPRWDLSYKNSTTELVHSRYFVLCATFPRAEFWNPLAEREPLLPFEMSFLCLVMGTTATMVSRTSPWHAVMSWHQQKTNKSQKLPQEILLSFLFLWIGHPNAFQTWFYVVIASLASNSWSSLIQYPPNKKKKHQKSSPKFPCFFFWSQRVPQLLSSLPLPFLSRYGPRAAHSPQVRYVAPSEGPRPSLPLLPGNRFWNMRIHHITEHLPTVVFQVLCWFQRGKLQMAANFRYITPNGKCGYASKSTHLQFLPSNIPLHGPCVDGSKIQPTSWGW